MEQSGKKKVMIAIDESEYSHYSLQWALENLRESLENSQVVIFTAQPIADASFVYASTYGSAPDLEFRKKYNTVYFQQEFEPNDPYDFRFRPQDAVEVVRSIQERHKNTAIALLEKAKEICSKYGVVAETVTEVGEPKEIICEAVEKHNIQLLVMGSHGRSALKRAFLGSVSNYCVHNAKCPVLVVKKTD